MPNARAKNIKFTSTHRKKKFSNELFSRPYTCQTGMSAHASLDAGYNNSQKRTQQQREKRKFPNVCVYLLSNVCDRQTCALLDEWVLVAMARAGPKWLLLSGTMRECEKIFIPQKFWQNKRSLTIFGGSCWMLKPSAIVLCHRIKIAATKSAGMQLFRRFEQLLNNFQFSTNFFFKVLPPGLPLSRALSKQFSAAE